MTIDGHPQLSILCAPVASYDRRALSQAWYSALYGTADSKTHKAGSSHAAQLQRGVPKRTASATASPARTRTGTAISLKARGASEQTQVRGAQMERRSERTVLAKAIERRFQNAAAIPRKAAFTIQTDECRVQILLRAEGERMRLVAICPPRAASGVAAALAQARYALALRGVDLDARARVEAPC